MQLGFLTGCLNMLPLEQIVPWAGAQGFGTLEISCWPGDNTRDYSGTHLDVARLDRAGAERVRALFDQHGVRIACLTYCDNNLHEDPATRAGYLEHLGKVIDAAGLLGVPNVSTFIGRDRTKTIAENLEEAARVFRPVLDHAKQRGVRIAIENCPMPGWVFEGMVGNVAFSPATWDRLFALLPDEHFGLNLDPSHLYPMEIDYLKAVRDYAPRIFHTHAKDAEIDLEKRAYQSNYVFSFDTWWRYRMPGLGAINWGRFIDALLQIGYDGALSTEHEDPVWEGSEAKIKQGLLLGQRHLAQFLP